MRRAWMRALALLMAGSVAVALGGCATETGPSASELKARWDAENVYPQGYRQDLLAFLRTYLNDPSQVRSASVSQPQLKYIGPGDRYIDTPKDVRELCKEVAFAPFPELERLSR